MQIIQNNTPQDSKNLFCGEENNSHSDNTIKGSQNNSAQGMTPQSNIGEHKETEVDNNGITSDHHQDIKSNPELLSNQSQDLTTLGDESITEQEKNIDGKSSLALTKEETVELTMASTSLPGEVFHGSVECINCHLYLSHYRIILTCEAREVVAVIPVANIDEIENRNPLVLTILCKEAKTWKLRFSTVEMACLWYKNLSHLAVDKSPIDKMFTFTLSSELHKQGSEHSNPFLWQIYQKGLKDGNGEESVEKEFNRLQYNKKHWRISTKNNDFKFCDTYPRKIIVPTSFSDEMLQTLDTARFLNRIPTAVWNCKETEAVLLRSSQPYIKFFMGPISEDVIYIDHCRKAIEGVNKGLHIIDARSYAAALANRTKFGGYETAECYPNTDINFRNLTNIHAVKAAFNELRTVLSSNEITDKGSALVQNGAWINYVSSLLETAIFTATLLFDSKKNVLVHCSDGWDRTSQITCLTKLICDPFYRTFEGFKVLLMRDWVEFGHKFLERNGLIPGDKPEERSPIFLQFIDCVFQLIIQFPKEFEFNEYFLIKLVHHSCSGLFVDFLFNSIKQKKETIKRLGLGTPEGPQILSFWHYVALKKTHFVNDLYNCNKITARIFPRYHVCQLSVFLRLYGLTHAEDKMNLYCGESDCSTETKAPERSHGIGRSVSAESLSNNDAASSLTIQSNFQVAYQNSEYPRSQPHPTQFTLEKYIDDDGMTFCKSVYEDYIYNLKMLLIATKEQLLQLNNHPDFTPRDTSSRNSHNGTLLEESHRHHYGSPLLYADKEHNLSYDTKSSGDRSSFIHQHNNSNHASFDNHFGEEDHVVGNKRIRFASDALSDEFCNVMMSNTSHNPVPMNLQTIEDLDNEVIEEDFLPDMDTDREPLEHEEEKEGSEEPSYSLAIEANLFSAEKSRFSQGTSPIDVYNHSNSLHDTTTQPTSISESYVFPNTYCNDFDGFTMCTSKTIDASPIAHGLPTRISSSSCSINSSYPVINSSNTVPKQSSSMTKPIINNFRPPPPTNYYRESTIKS